MLEEEVRKLITDYFDVNPGSVALVNNVEYYIFTKVEPLASPNFKSYNVQIILSPYTGQIRLSNTEDDQYMKLIEVDIAECQQSVFPAYEEVIIRLSRGLRRFGEKLASIAPRTPFF